MKKTLLASLVLFSFITTVDAQERKIGVDKISDLKITIYNENLALVKDKRKAELKEGLNDIAFEGISAMLRPETALVKGDGIRILEQNFNYDLLSPYTVLTKAVGENVKVIKTLDSGKVMEKEGIVLSSNNGLILKMADGILLNPEGEMIFSKVPENLREKPTLVLSMLSENASNKDLELSYLTKGLSWKADYIAELNPDDNKIALSGLVTLNNNSGTNYDDASLQLVAGDVNQVGEIVLRASPMMARSKVEDFTNSASMGMREEEFSDFHLYTLPRKVSIKDRQIKQVSMLSGNDIKVEKQYVYESPFRLHRNSNQGFEKLNPNSYLKFKNDESNNLGIALPKGIIRVYKADKNDNMLFTGEDNITHTPRNENVKLNLGKVFDITAEGKILESSSYQKRYDMKFEVIFKNAKKEDAEVVFEQLFPANFNIEQEDIKSTRENARKVVWNVKVPASSESKLVVKFNVMSD